MDKERRAIVAAVVVGRGMVVGEPDAFEGCLEGGEDSHCSLLVSLGSLVEDGGLNDDRTTME